MDKSPPGNENGVTSFRQKEQLCNSACRNLVPVCAGFLGRRFTAFGAPFTALEPAVGQYPQVAEGMHTCMDDLEVTLML